MTAMALLKNLQARDIRLTVDGDRLTYDAPDGAMTPEVLALVREHKTTLLAMLRQDGTPLTTSGLAGVNAPEGVKEAVPAPAPLATLLPPRLPLAESEVGMQELPSVDEQGTPKPCPHTHTGRRADGTLVCCRCTALWTSSAWEPQPPILYCDPGEHVPFSPAPQDSPVRQCRHCPHVWFMHDNALTTQITGDGDGDEVLAWTS